MAWINSMTTNNVYNYYLTTYAPKSTSPYDTHKKSELRKIYNMCHITGKRLSNLFCGYEQRNPAICRRH